MLGSCSLIFITKMIIVPAQVAGDLFAIVVGLLIIVPALRVGMQFVTLCVTQRFCYVSDICVRLRSPFRPSASYFDEAKVTKAFRSCFRPDFVGFLRPVTDP
ncbi:hypothetical protein RYA97_23805, partial [Pseudomonas syringae group sp. 26L6]|nr:hypothetical protein [Pseudomonas syringae group sp. 26L6]